jgi:hypothetical protein
MAMRAAPDPIVIMLPRQPSGTYYCEMFWLVVETPVQAVSNYALTFVPGAAAPPLDRILADRRRYMNAAITRAAGGTLSIADIAAMAETMVPGRPVLLFSDATLTAGPDARLERIAGNDRFTLWRILRASPTR